WLMRLQDEVPGKGGDGRLDGDVIAGRAHHGHHYARFDDRVGVGGHLYAHVVGLAVKRYVGGARQPVQAHVVQRQLAVFPARGQEVSPPVAVETAYVEDVPKVGAEPQGDGDGHGEAVVVGEADALVKPPA